MKNTYFLICALSVLLSGGLSSAASVLTQDDLFVYHDFKASNGSGGNANRITPVIAPEGSQFNPCLNNQNKHSSTGGYGNGGYVASSGVQMYSPSCENLNTEGGLGYSNQGMAFSLKFCDIGTAGISITSFFSGTSPLNDASFRLSGDALVTPGGPAWTMAEGRSSINSHTGTSYGDLSTLGAPIPWQSIVISLASDGIISVYLDGSLFATSNSAWNRTSGLLNKVRFGGNGNNTSANSDGLYSDFAIWNKALTAEDAALLANQSTAEAIAPASIPEPATASLALLGMVSLTFVRRRRF